MMLYLTCLLQIWSTILLGIIQHSAVGANGMGEELHAFLTSELNTNNQLYVPSALFSKKASLYPLDRGRVDRSATANAVMNIWTTASEENLP